VIQPLTLEAGFKIYSVSVCVVASVFWVGGRGFVPKTA
jgi:hypothetical protein